MKQKSKAQIEEEIRRMIAWTKKVIPEDYDKIDTRAIYDSTLSYEENKGIMRDKLKVLIKDLKSDVSYAKQQEEILKQQQEILDKEKIKEAEKEVESYNTNLKYKETKDIDQFYLPIVNGINKMCQGYSNLLFIKGRGATGKSFQIRKALIKNKANYVEMTGEVTEAYLYRLIFENNGKIIWMNDIVKLLQSQGAINLMKAATETQRERVLTKSNYSKVQDDLPDRFLCKCKFIFDYNNICGSALQNDFEALISRGDYNELPYSDDDIKTIMRAIATEKWEKEVTEYIIDTFNSNSLIKMNLRTQWKAYQTYKYAKKNKLDWKKELERELTNISRIRSLLYTLIGTKAVKTTELKKKMLREEIVHSRRTAHRKINDWLFMDELFRWGEGERDFFVCINQKV